MEEDSVHPDHTACALHARELGICAASKDMLAVHEVIAETYAPEGESQVQLGNLAWNVLQSHLDSSLASTSIIFMRQTHERPSCAFHAAVTKTHSGPKTTPTKVVTTCGGRLLANGLLIGLRRQATGRLRKPFSDAVLAHSVHGTRMQENNRLIDLLSRIDLEKSHLQQALSSLQSVAVTSSPAQAALHHDAHETIPAIHRPGAGTAPAALQATLPIAGLPKATMPGLVAGAAPEMATTAGPDADVLQQLKADLVAEQARRKQAEQDFQVSFF